MLYNLLEFFLPEIFQNVYIRAAASLFTSLFFSFLIFPFFIKYSQKFKLSAREYIPEAHKNKNNIPSLGGLPILFIVSSSALLWGNLINPELWILITCLLAFGAIGLWDDIYKIKYSKGISEYKKFLTQIIVSLFIITSWYYIIQPETAIFIPIFKSYNISLDFGILLIPWAVFVLTGASNSVNLTDGLDGLAIGSLIPNFALFSIISYLSGNIIFSNYFNITFTDTAEITIIAASLLGASISFLWYNSYPAQIFMGDVGSLSLGAGLGLIALMVRQEFLLIFSGIIFVIETLSVIAQIIFFKLYKKRIFKMAPLHHHFELSGMPEPRITVRFNIVTFIFCLIIAFGLTFFVRLCIT